MLAAAAPAKRPNRCPRRGLRGNVVLAMLVMTSLVLLGMPFTVISLTESRHQEWTNGDLTALAVAEAGVELVRWEYNHNSGTFATPTPWTDVSSDQACTPAGITCLSRSYPLPLVNGISAGTATIFVKDVRGTAPSVHSKGQGQGLSVKSRVQATLQQAPVSPFTGALIANGNIDITGVDSLPSYVDGYDSRTGAYGSGNKDLSAQVGTVGDRTITLNGSVNGNVNLKGDVYGYNAVNPPTVVITGPVVWGGVARSGGTRAMAAVQWPNPCTNPPGMPPTCQDQSGRLTVASGAECVLPPGTYCFPGGVAVLYTGTLKTSGTVEMYVAGPFYMESLTSLLPYQEKPQAFRVYSVANIPYSELYQNAFDMRGPTKTMGIFYHDPTVPGGAFVIAPNTGGNFYGSIVANDYSRMVGLNIHYDHALAGLTDLPRWFAPNTAPLTSAVVASWSRENVP